MRYQHFLGISVGTSQIPEERYQQTGDEMPLTDTFIKQVKHTGAPAGDKHTDGQGLFLLVKEAGKYWRLSYLLICTEN